MLRLPYKSRARLQPALIAALPLALSVLVWYPRGFEGQAVLFSLLSWVGIASLAMTVTRDRGRAIESGLWQSWGGAPTTRMLRFRDSTNKALLALRHQALRVVAPEVKLPESAAAEAANRTAADSAYEACVSVLRSSTRDRHKFPLVFEENCDYGFRRNLLGLRSVGIIVVVLGLIAMAGHVWRTGVATPLDVAAIAITVLEGGLLLCIVTPDWVRRAADSYANRLLEAAVEIAKAAKSGP